MKPVVPLEKARDESLFGAKAVGLGDAMRAGLPVPPGVALCGSVVEAVACGEERALKQVTKSVRSLPGPLAVRSSAVDEDGADASFAGQHLTLLNVASSSSEATASTSGPASAKPGGTGRPSRTASPSPTAFEPNTEVSDTSASGSSSFT